MELAINIAIGLIIAIVAGISLYRVHRGQSLPIERKEGERKAGILKYRNPLPENPAEYSKSKKTGAYLVWILALLIGIAYILLSLFGIYLIKL